MSPKTVSLGALRTKRLVGRKKERAAIKKAIETKNKLVILRFFGVGGIGKTRLLEAIRGEILPTCSNRNRCQFGGIFDLYDPDLHTSRGIEDTIMKSIDPQKRYFKEYRRRRAEYETLLRTGKDPQRRDQLWRQLGDLFVADLNEFTKTKRLILCFDTAEVIQHESDVVDEICGPLEGFESGSWLVRHVPRIENAVAIFSNRPFKRSEDDFLKSLERRMQTYELKRFTEAEVLEYIDQLAETAGKERAFVQTLLSIKRDSGSKIYERSQGVPLRVGILVDMLLDGLINPSDLDRMTSPIENYFLDWANKFEKNIGNALPYLPYVAWLRKGVDAELLRQVSQRDLGECQKILNGLKRFVFSKPRGRRMFLHDEMYSWMQDKVLKKREEEREEVCQTAINYYDDLILGGVKQKRVLLAEQVYYHVVKNQRNGFERFARLATEAVLEHDFDFELMLRDEVLRAFNEWHTRVPDYYHRDAAVRRVMRIIETVGTNRHTYEEAIRTAAKILGTSHPVFVGYQGLNDTLDPLFTLALWTYRAEAQLYSGQEPPPVMRHMFEDIIKRLG